MYAETNRNGFRSRDATIQSEAKDERPPSISDRGGFPVFDLKITGASDGHDMVYVLGRSSRSEPAFGGEGHRVKRIHQGRPRSRRLIYRLTHAAANAEVSTLDLGGFSMGYRRFRSA